MAYTPNRDCFKLGGVKFLISNSFHNNGWTFKQSTKLYYQISRYEFWICKLDILIYMYIFTRIFYKLILFSDNNQEYISIYMVPPIISFQWWSGKVYGAASPVAYIRRRPVIQADWSRIIEPTVWSRQSLYK